MRDGNRAHNLKCRLEGFEYTPVSKSGSKLTVRNEKSEIIYEGAFKSFTANFMKLLYGNMIGSGTVTATDLNGDSADIDSYPNVKMNFAGGSGVQKFGIGVGSSATAVSSSDNDLTWVSGLTYGSVIVGTPSIVGSTVKLDITREISNTSGSTKALYESGLIIGAEDETDENILIARDNVAVTLLNNEKSTWTYSIVVDFDSSTGGFVKNFLDSFVIDWTEVLADGHSQWSQRYLHQCVVYDSKIWIIGGYNGSNFNDVYSSTDGSTWTTVLADGHSQWSQRRSHQCVVHDSKIWIIGGNAISYFNDVYSSTDGSTWTEVLADGHSQWSQRRSHQCVVHDSKIWIIGGKAISGFNDVWNNKKQSESSEDASEDTYGIVVGTSDTAFSGTDTALDSKIDNGTGSGELEYSAMPYSTTIEPNTSGSTTSMTLTRRFENNSGASITIKEVGIQSVNGLLCRFIPTTPIVIVNGGSEIISIVFESEV